MGLFLSVADSPGAGEPPAAAVAAAGLARMDSLLAASAPAAAVDLGLDLVRAWGQDPLYGWQVNGRLGLALLRDARAEQALPFLETAVQGNPQDAALHRTIGAALRGLGRRGRALTEYQSAVELDPTDFVVRLEYANFLLEFGDQAGAERHIRLAADLCPGCTEVARALANLHLHRQDFASAVPPLQAVWAAEPGPPVRRLLAIALERSGRPDEAERLLQPWAPGDLDPDEQRLLVRIEAGRPGSGAPHSLDFARMLAAVPDSLAATLRDDPAFWETISANLLACGLYGPGLQAADRSLALDPASAVAHNNRAALLLKLGRREEAAAAWDRALALDPSLAVKDRR